MSLKRLSVLFVFALVVAGAFASSASPLAIDDSTCPDAAGENTNTCPIGTVGVPYSIKFKEREGSGCYPGGQTFAVISGALPPGLSLASDGAVTGTPTQAGGFKFYLEMSEPPPSEDPPCRGDKTQKEYTIPINPGVPVPPPLPRLIIGPEFVSPGTVGTPYMAAMSANLPDAKTWSVVAGTLPTGLMLGATDGVISGMPAVPGAYSFTVQALIADGRSDTKGLTLEVRDRLTLVRSGDFETRVVRTEVGVEFDGGLFATGGFGAYLWSVDGDLPPGLTLDDDGSITGSPEEAGSYRFTLAVTDAEGRRAGYAARVVVAERLRIKTKRLNPGRVGRFLSRKVATLGGVGPKTTRVTRGPLPRGIFFDRLAGIFVGSPAKAGTWKIRVQVIDSLGIKATGFVVLVVRK